MHLDPVKIVDRPKFTCPVLCADQLDLMRKAGISGCEKGSKGYHDFRRTMQKDCRFREDHGKKDISDGRGGFHRQSSR